MDKHAKYLLPSEGFRHRSNVVRSRVVATRSGWCGKRFRRECEWKQRQDKLAEIQANLPKADHSDTAPADGCLTVLLSFSAMEREATIRQFSRQHNDRLTALDAQRQADWKANRLARIRAAQEQAETIADCARMFKQLTCRELRRTNYVHKPIVPSAPVVPMEAYGAELIQLAETIRDKSKRFDILAQCWIVRAEYPTAQVTAIWARASSIVRDVERGRMQDGNSTIAEGENLREDCDPFPHADAQSVDSWIESLRSVEWSDILPPDELSALEAGDDSLIVAGAKRGLGQTAIAEMIGRSQSYVSNRLATIRQDIERSRWNRINLTTRAIRWAHNVAGTAGQ